MSRRRPGPLAVAGLAVAVAAAALAPRAAHAQKIFLNASDQTANAVACGGDEAEYAADEGQRAQGRLQGYGFDVQYSQDFTNAPTIANNWGADVFVSIHSNAGGAHGTETLYTSTAGQVLAGHVNQALVAALTFPDRGLKLRTNLHVLNATAMPATLTEVLFHDCTTSHATPIGAMSESCFLVAPQGRAIVAEAIAQGVCAHFGATCPAGPLSHPALTLATAIEAVAGQEPDLVGADGIFDLLVGQETLVRFTVINAGAATVPAVNVVAGLALAGSGLAITEWRVYDNAPTNACGGDWCPNDADGDVQNPPHADPGDVFDLRLSDFAAGEAKRIELLVRGTAPTAGTHPEVRLFVRHVDDFYDKGDWDAAADNVGGSQTWNGGDLRIASALDVWDAVPPDDGGASSPDGGLPLGDGGLPLGDGGLPLRPRAVTGGCATAPAAPEAAAPLLLALLIIALARRRR